MTGAARAAARQLVSMLATLVVASIGVFGLLALMPGDPAEQLASRDGTRPSPEAVQAMREQLGLDRPVPVQYLSWLGNALRGDLGRSWANGASVSDLLGQRIPASLLLGCSVLALGLALTVTVGGLAGLRPGGLADRLSQALAIAGTAIPTFLLGLLAIRFLAVGLGLGQVIGDGTLRTLPLPACVGAVGLAAFWLRPFRSLVADALATDWALACRARGAGEGRLLAAHVLPNSLLGFLPFLGLGLAGVLGGSVLLENVFSWPGVGPFVIESITRRDLPVVQGFALVSLTFYIATTGLTGVVSAALDPHRRPAGGPS